MSFSSRAFDKLWHWDVAEVVSPIEDLKKEDVKTMNMQNKYIKSTHFFCLTPSISNSSALCDALSDTLRWRQVQDIDKLYINDTALKDLHVLFQSAE